MRGKLRSFKSIDALLKQTQKLLIGVFLRMNSIIHGFIVTQSSGRLTGIAWLAFALEHGAVQVPSLPPKPDRRLSSASEALPRCPAKVPASTNEKLFHRQASCTKACSWNLEHVPPACPCS